MRRGLSRKLMLLLLFLLGCILLYLNIFLPKQMKSRLTYKSQQEMYEDVGIITQNYVVKYYSNRTTITKLKEDLIPIADMLQTRIWIMAPEGRVVADTAPVAKDVIDLSLIDADFMYETFHEDVYFRGAMESPVLAVVVPINYEYVIRGYLCMMKPMSQIQDEVNEKMNVVYLIYVITLFAFFIFYLGGYVMAIVPLRKTIRAAKAYSLGSFKKKIVVHSRGEYKELSDIINYMGDTMFRFDEYQRKIIANISHDFRSPLTSIKGYAEAMKDGTIPVDQQAKYLDVVVFEVERLTKLTNNLLALNTFDQKGMLLHFTEFNLNEEIKGLVRSFEGTCKKKRLEIHLIFSEEETYVRADQDRIEQVLYNLVENAIKFSHADSQIFISVEEMGKKAMVSIRDHGIGIPRESQSKIWDRFYKSDSSRGKDKKGTGLGLSIVKEIIQAHQENINVISTEGVGTEFVFTLPLVKPEE